MKTRPAALSNPLSATLTFGVALILLPLPSANSQTATGLQVGIAQPSSANESNRTAYLTWTAVPGNNYLVQSSTNLGNPAGWTTEDAVSAGTVGPLKWMAPEALEVQKYYRLILPQPQIFSVEPAIVTPGVPVDFYLLGQNFPTNALVQFNGVTQSGTVYSNSTTLVQPAFTPAVAGTYQVSLVISGVVVSTFNVVAADPLANPELVLQGPPDEPPASPSGAARLFVRFQPDQRLGNRSISAGGVGGGWNRVKNVASVFGVGGGWNRVKNLANDVEGNLQANRQWQPGAADPGGPMLTRPMQEISGYSFDIEQELNIGSQASEGGTIDPDGPGGNPPVAAKPNNKSVYVSRSNISNNRTGGRVVARFGRPAVNTFSGEVEESDVDLAVPGRGLDFIWARTYHSRIGRSGSATNGWTFSYDVRCAQNSSGGVDIYDGTGRKDTFTPGTNGVYTSPQFFREGTLSNNTFTLTFADTGRWVFNAFDGTSAAGKLVQIITRNGDTMTLGYDTSGRLAQVVDDLGRTNTVGYNTSGLLASVTDFSGRSVTYQYYSGGKSDNGNAGDLASVTSPPVTGTPNGNDFPSGKTTTYTYSKSFSLDRENHLLLTVTNPKGQPAAVFSYEHSSTSTNYLHCIAAQEGTNTAFTYSWSLKQHPSGSAASLNNPSESVPGFFKCIANDPVGNVTESFFDARGRCVLEREFTGRATPGLPVTDTVNRPTGQVRSTDPAYYETQWAWNNDSICTAEMAPDGQQVQYVYQSDFDPATTARKRADCRVVREIASSPVDLDGDGVPDVISRAWYYTYDPRFGSGAAGGRVKVQFHWDREDKGWDGTIKGCFVRGDKPTGEQRLSGKGWDGTIKGHFETGDVPTQDQMVSGKGWDGTVKGIKGLVVPDGNGMAINTKGTGANKNRTSDLPRRKGWDGLIYGPSRVAFVTTETDPRGNGTTASYDGQGNLASFRKLTGRSSYAAITMEADLGYDAHGQLTSITNAADASGRRRVDTFSWSQGQITNSVVDAGGLALTESYEYDARGNLTRCVDPRTNDWLFTYNALDQLVQASSALSANGSLGTFRTASQIAYDANDNLVQTATELRDPTGTLQGSQVDNYQYDGEDRLSQVALAIDASHALTNRYAYDGNDECVQVLGPDAVSGTDPNQTEVFQYDERGLLFQSCAAPGTVLAVTNQYSYDANARTSAHAQEKLTVIYETWSYDGFGRLASATDEMGNVTAWNYDALGLVGHEIRYGKRSDAPPGTSNTRLSESRWQYDALNRPVQVSEMFFDPATQSPIGGGVAVSSCVYAPNDELVSMTDSLGRTSSFGYDSANRLASVTDARGDVAVSVRDQSGNVTSVTETDISSAAPYDLFIARTFVYDALNRCVNSADNVGNTDSFAYDSLDRVVRETNPNGNDTTYAYDLLGDCLASADYAGSSSSTKPVVLRRSSATYDTSARCLTSTDPNGNTTSYACDSLGDCTTVTEADGTQLQKHWLPSNFRTVETDPNGTTVTNIYDLSDRLVHRDIAARGAAVATTTFETFAYDGCDRLVLASNDVSQLTFSYDSLGDCTGSSQDGLAQSTTYDSEGNPLSLTYPSGRVVSYAYDALNQVTNISTSANGVSHPQLARFAYAGPGRLAGIARDNGINTRLTWNGYINPANSTGDYGWLQVSRVHDGTVASPSLVSDVTGTYSPAQSKLTRADAGRSSLTLTYDALEQLVEASDSVHTRDTIYALDAAGNRSHVITNGVLMTPDYSLSSTLPPGDFQMNRYTTTPFGGQSYDANGNLIARANAASPMFYHYDYADRLVEVDAVGTLGTLGPVATFTYDALGNRISKTTYPASPAAPVTTQYVCDTVSYQDNDDRTTRTRAGNKSIINTSVLQESVNGVVVRSYCRPPTQGGGWVLVGFTAAGAVQHYHFDELGNVLALTDGGGNVLERYAYDDYGQPQFLDGNGSPLVDSTGQPVTASPTGNPLLFRSLEWDDESGLLGDGGGDYFDPLTGRAIRGKVKNIKIDSVYSIGNNPWSGSGSTTAMLKPPTTSTGHVKFYRLVFRP